MTYQTRRRGLFALVLTLSQALLCLTGISGCGREQVPRTGTLDDGLRAPFPYSSVAEIGSLHAPVKQQADQMHKWALQGDIVGGELLVLQHGKIVLHEVSGWSDKERRIALQKNSIYRVRSMTKPLIGTAVLLLADEGRLQLDDPAAVHLDSFDNPQSADITILQLLQHRAGYPSGWQPEEYWNQTTLSDAVDLVGSAGPPSQPGEQYAYSDLSSAVLGAVVEAVSGQPVEQFLHERVLAPLGMMDTHTRFEPGVSWAGRLNPTYHRDRRKWLKAWDASMEQEASYFRPAGGLYSTVFDYARFMQLWLNEGRLAEQSLVSSDSVHLALNKQIEANYGQHWEIWDEPEDADGLPSFGHGGAGGTIAIAVPGQDIIVLYFTQSQGTVTRDQLRDMVLDLQED